MPIKADGHYLPRAIYTGMKRKQFPNYHSYKQLFREAVHDIISLDKYNNFIIDTEVETVYQLQQYEARKVYSSSTVDMLLAALTGTCSITLVVYYVSNGKVQTYTFKPPYTASLTYLKTH